MIMRKKLFNILLVTYLIFNINFVVNNCIANSDIDASHNVAYNSAASTFYDNNNSYTVLNSSSIIKEVDLSIYSEACILIESSSGKILYEKDATKKMFPASTTKIMTAILTLENCNLNDIATVSQNAVESIPYSYSTANLHIGEKFSVEQLLNLLLIPSANDAAVVLAEFVGGSVENFASMMNTKANELGCINTHFVNPNGIHYTDPNGNSYLDHFSCAYDLALIGKYAMQNSTFRSIVCKTNYSLPGTSIHPAEDRNFSNSNELLHNNRRYYYEYTTGVKTGYTDPAGDCIVASSKKDNIEYIVVTLNGDDLPDGSSARYTDCKTLFDYAFTNYSIRTIISANSILKQVDIFNANDDTKLLDVIVQDDISAFLNNSIELESLQSRVELNPILAAPITQNSVIGKIVYIIDGEVYSSNLLAGSDVVPSKSFYSITIIVVLIFILFVVYKLARRKNKGGH